MPRDLGSAPTDDYLHELYEHIFLGSYWNPQRELDKQILRLIGSREGEYKVYLEDTAAEDRNLRITPERMVSNEAARTVKAVASWYTLPAEVRARHIGEARHKPKTEGDKLEQALAEARDQLNPPTDSPRARQVWQMASIGRAASFIVPGGVDRVAAYWHDFPFKTKGETEAVAKKRRDAWRHGAPGIPVAWLDLPAESTFPPSFGSMDTELMTKKKQTGWELRDIFSEEELAGAEVSTQDEWLKTEHDFIIYSNPDWLTYAVASEKQEDMRVLRHFHHKMGQPAIRIHPGRTGEKVPGKYWLSPLHFVIEMIEGLDRRLSELATAAKQTVMPNWLMYMGDPTQAQARFEQNKRFDAWPMNPGNPQEGTPRDEMVPLQHPETGDDTRELAVLAMDQIRSITGVSAAVDGSASSPQSTAWARAIDVDQVHANFLPMTNGIIGMDMTNLESIMKAVEVFGEPAYVTPKEDDDSTALILDPKRMAVWTPTLSGKYVLSIPPNRLAMIQIGMAIMQQAKDGQFMGPSQRWVLEEFLQIKQPRLMYEEVLEEEHITSEELRGPMRKLVAQGFGVDLAAARTMSLEEAMEIAEAEGFPPEAIAIMQERAASRGIGGGAAQGARQAGTPLGAQPGNQPQAAEPTPSVA